MGLGEAIYATCSAAFLALIALSLLRGRIGAVGIAVTGACALSAAWAAGSAVAGFLYPWVSPVLDSLRLSAWLILLVAFIGLRSERHRRLVSLPFVVTVGFCVIAVAYDLAPLIVAGTEIDSSHRLDDFLRVGYGVGGLMAVENLLRNAEGARRRNIWPLCLALGGTFAFELFLSADRLMAPGLNIALAEGHGLVGLFAAPLLAMAMVRNSDWRIDIHVSRRIVLHTAALVASGLFFLTLAAVGILVRQFGGSWGPALQLLTLLGSAIVLVSVLGSRDIRVHLKRIISRHFFTHRFDYRMEWLRFTETVTQLDDDESTLGVRVVRALAQIVDSPAGTLWCLQGDTKYVPEAGWNMPAGSAEKLFADDRFVAGFRGGDWIQQQPNGPEESWPPPLDRAWLGIPLSHRTELIGFVTLATPAQFYPLDWEAFDLLRAAGKQAASYLAEERSTRTLLDTRMLTDYSKRFAFVVHDMRNLAYQLGLVVGNARRYIDDREFRQSMLQTLEDSVAKMNRMLARLRTSGEEEQQQLIEPDFVIANLTQELSNAGMRIETRLGAHTGRVGIASEQFHSVLLHLINNACDASQPDCAIVVTSYRSQNKIIIDVVDSGPGMDEEFIRDELFRPFRSTKSDGLGIGAYQTRELLRMAGGELEVISKAGVGTTMRVILPTRDEARLKSTAA